MSSKDETLVEMQLPDGRVLTFMAAESPQAFRDRFAGKATVWVDVGDGDGGQLGFEVPRAHVMLDGQPMDPEVP